MESCFSSFKTSDKGNFQFNDFQVVETHDFDSI